jgi:hypothetical protein
MQKRYVTENGLRANFYHPVDGAQRRAIIFLGGSEGGVPFASYENLIQPLLDLGHPVLFLAYFGMKGLPPSLQKVPLEYFERAFDWLAAQPGILPNEYAVMGGSRGGELALLLASRYSQVKAVAAFVPSHVVWPGLPKGIPRPPFQLSSWSYAGEDLPFVPIPYSPALLWGLLTFRQRKMFEQGLHNTQRVAQAVIPVEKIGGPILLISGRQDTVWPCAPMCEQVVNRLAANHFPFPYQHVAFDAGHLVMMEKAFWPTVTGYLQEHFA